MVLGQVSTHDSWGRLKFNPDVQGQLSALEFLVVRAWVLTTRSSPDLPSLLKQQER